MCIYNMFSYITTVIIILRGDKMKNKNTLLYDFMEIYKKIECDTVEDVIKNIGDLYNESK